MQQLTLIVHTDSQKDLTEQLRRIDKVRGFTFSHVEGRGAELESDPFLSARDKVVGHSPRVRADILLEDADVDPVIATLRSAMPAARGHAFFWVTAVAKSGHL